METSLTKKQIAKIIGITFLAVLLIGVSIFGAFASLYNASSPETVVSVEDVSEQIINIKNDITSSRISLSSSEAFSASDTGNSISKTITATVLPEDAPDKSVDWSISWITPISDDAVATDYVTVTPDSDGSTTATVTCYKGFEGASIRVTATTRVGGYTAGCVVTYDGAPTKMTFECNGQSYSSYSKVLLSAGTTTSIDINLSNALDCVGSKYGDFEIVSIEGYLSCVLLYQYVVNGTVDDAYTKTITFNLENGYYQFTNPLDNTVQTVEVSTDEFFTASVSGNVLTINAIKNELSYVWPSAYPRTGSYVTYSGAYSMQGYTHDPYWVIYMREKNSGYEFAFKLDIQSSVTSVSLSSSTLAF